VVTFPSSSTGKLGHSLPIPHSHQTSEQLPRYTPSFALAAFAVVFFTVAFILHTFQLVRTRSWYFTSIAVALLLEVVGYVARSLSAKVSPYNILYFVLQYFFIVTAPVLISAGIYAVLSVLVTRTGRQYSPLPPKWVLGIFITADVVATLLQLTGAAMVGVAQSKRTDPTTANNILLIGLALQVFAFLVFIILASIFLYRARTVVFVEQGRKAFIWSLIVATLAVYLRTCFRLAETAQGLGMELSSREGYFVGLEFVPIAVAVVLLGWWHPGRYLLREKNEDAETENMGAEEK
jgi:hypothetical protein